MNKKAIIDATADTIISILEHISKDYHCAGWLTGIEHTMWEDCINPDPIPDDTIDFLYNHPWRELDMLRSLAAQCKGWIRQSMDPNVAWENSKVFVPMDDWIKIHAQYVGHEMTDEQRKRFETFMSGPELAAKELAAQRERLGTLARVALAIQASGQEGIHNDFLEILKMIPEELRCCPGCQAHPGEECVCNKGNTR